MSKTKRLKFLAGFTLVETLIYIALAVAVLIVVVEMVLAGSRTLATISREQSLTGSAIVVLNKLSREVRVAKTVSEVQTKFYVSDGVLKFNDAGNMRSLTLPELEVINFIITPLTSAHSLAATISYTLHHRDNPTISYDFLTTLGLRASYPDYE